MADQSDHPEFDPDDPALPDDPMMVSRAELVDAVQHLQQEAARAAALEKALAEMRQERDHWRTHKLSDTESDVIASVVRALEPLRRQGTQTLHYAAEDNAVARVLRHVADRYGIEFVKVVEPPSTTMAEADAERRRDAVRAGLYQLAEQL